ncbi:MAG: helix-turn-helix transcriptional regulator [Clostridia bacterium]|nr:helix-turn-helix transcriptional regulator [Clostridia bacterium]
MERNLEQIVAANLAELRRAKNWTQAELAEKINYSDKSVSKWERGEGLPDLKVLTQLAELYGVTLDCFVTVGGAEQKTSEPEIPRTQRVGFRVVMELLAVSLVFLAATVFYVITATYLQQNFWTSFIWALPLSFLLLTLFNLRWKYRACAVVFCSIFSWTFLAAIYLQLLSYNAWMLFLIGIPAQAAIVLLSQVRKK